MSDDFRNWVFGRAMYDRFGRAWEQAPYEEKRVTGLFADKVADGVDPFHAERESSHLNLSEDILRDIKTRQATENQEATDE